MAAKQRGTKSLNAQKELLDGLLQLMGRKKLKDISVTELCERSGVSRMAFYRNYDSKEEILVRYLDDRFELYLDEARAEAIDKPYDFALMFFRYFGKQRRFLRLLVKSGMQTILLERFDRYLLRIFDSILAGRADDSPAFHYAVQFASGGLYKTLVDWVSRGPEASEEEMAAIVGGLMGDWRAGDQSGSGIRQGRAEGGQR